MMADHAFEPDGLSEDDTARLSPASPAALGGPPAPVGADAAAVSTWFDAMVEVEPPALDGSLAAGPEAGRA
jgi:hypothetical protein